MIANFPENTWRYIPPLEGSGRLQMAIDRWLVEKHQKGQHPPSLRFYTWSPATISLGYHQHHYPEAWHHLSWQGEVLDIVRRPSGGRGVLHQGDLTYCVVTSGLPGKRVEVYQKICAFLLKGWRSLGIELGYGKAAKGYIHHPNCFATATGADLVTPEGYKFIGSAQLRQGKAILQHGSMLLTPNRDLFREVFGGECLPPSQFFAPFSEKITQKDLINALTKAAEVCFAMQLRECTFSPAEWKEIFTLEGNLT